MDRLEERDIEVRRHDAGLGEVLDLIVHELRNPVAVMKGFATTFEAAADSMDPTALRKASSGISRSADRLDALLASLSDVRSLDSDNLKIDPHPTLVSALLEAAVEGSNFVSADRRISVRIEDDVTVLADPVRMQQVLSNLVSNAVKFSPQRTTVEISASRIGNEAHICVRDQGPGIPRALRDWVFERFTRVNRTVNGTGIGLYISRGIARAHGGELELVDATGRGCTFLLRLPVHAEA